MYKKDINSNIKTQINIMATTTIKVATSGKKEFEAATKKTKTIEILGFTKGRKYISFVLNVEDISELFLLGQLFSESFKII